MASGAQTADVGEFGAQKSFGGRFNPQHLIHRGALADLWLVTNERGKPCALRLLKPELRFSLRSRRRFLRGCQVFSQLNESEYLAGYVEHGKLDGTLYLLMDYVEASNLQLRLARQDPVLTENAAQILIDMAAGLGHIHESGFMHLDFKPDNVLVTGDGNVRLIGFDLAQPILEKPKRAPENSSFPAYLSPEQLQGRPVDARVDIFAYGVAAYELLTNQRPFPGGTPEEILGAQLEPASPIPPREHNADIPPALENIVLKCLSRDPDRRYPFVSVLVHELQNALYV
jgi:eukaryotic-like serine/threonine-protein kinase